MSGSGNRQSTTGPLLLVSVVMLSAIVGATVPAAGAEPEFAALGEALPLLDITAPIQPTDTLMAYRRYYGLVFDHARHHAGYFSSAGYRIAAQILIPPAPAGTLFLMHGYFDHTGTLKHLIAACLDNGWAVAVFDLPGHGLSSGERGAIGDFADYVTVLSDFIDAYGEKLPAPFHLVAHSTGCAIAYEYLNHVDPGRFGRVVFLAPLVRNAHWHLSTIGYRLARPFIDRLPRTNRRNSSDDAFLRFTRDDPLQNTHLSIRFLDALHAWNRRIGDYHPIPTPVRIIQGTRDDIVDWKYNLAFLKTKLPAAEIDLVEGARHQLANEIPPLRRRVFDDIFDFITER